MQNARNLYCNIDIDFSPLDSGASSGGQVMQAETEVMLAL